MNINLDEHNTRMEAYLRKLLKNINNKINNAENRIDRCSRRIEAFEESDELDNDEVSMTKENKNDLENAVERYKDIRSYIEKCILAEETLQEINEDYMDCLPEEIDNKQKILELMKKIEKQIEIARKRDNLDEFELFSNSYNDFAVRISQIERNS